MRCWLALGAAALLSAAAGCSSSKRGSDGTGSESDAANDGVAASSTSGDGSTTTQSFGSGGASATSAGGASATSVGGAGATSTSATAGATSASEGGASTTTDTTATTSSAGESTTSDSTTTDGGDTSAGAGGTGGAQTIECGSAGVVSVDAGRLCVDGRAFHIRGVNWNPVPKGGEHPQDLDYAGFADQDIALMATAGINAVRTYEPLTDVVVLDKLYAAGIRVLDSVYVYGADDPSVVLDRITGIQDHPAILMWVLGNEWNYNGLYVDLAHADSMSRINQAAALLQANDDVHPVATVYGELPTQDTIDSMPDIDVWGINSYRGLSFGDLFSGWSPLTEKPMFLGEYGADAYNANIDAYDPDSQAQAVDALTREIAEQSVAAGGEGPCVGGLVFEWADEWWKDAEGSPDVHDVGGVAPGGGPYPDQTFNEEWWGLVDIDRNPRPAYDAIAGVFAGL